MGSARLSSTLSQFTIVVGTADVAVREQISKFLTALGYSVEIAKSPPTLLKLKSEPRVVIIQGLAYDGSTVGKIVQRFAQSQIIILGSSLQSNGGNQNERIWYQRSASDLESLALLVAKACVMQELLERAAELEAVVGGSVAPPRLPFRSEIMRALMRRVDQTAKRDATVLLRGETGTGKTSLARLIHELSERRGGPFITVSCAALPRELLEAELFGYERGAFTGATQSRPGCAELADGGTLFLDEIGDLPFELQPKLLTFLQERWVRRLGAREVRHPDVRIIAATHRNLHEMVAKGSFREDLLYRLEVLELVVPALRERAEDIREISSHYLKESSRRRGDSPRNLSPAALRKLEAYRWPGNVRELQNVLERALAYSASEVIDADELEIREAPSDQRGEALSLGGLTLKELERKAILEALERTHGDKAAAAELLGISLKSIYNKLAGSR